ncbi:MAG: hypothetical protein R3C05_28785 [Pirellulaceae bacterium]
MPPLLGIVISVDIAISGDIAISVDIGWPEAAASIAIISGDIVAGSVDTLVSVLADISPVGIVIAGSAMAEDDISGLIVIALDSVAPGMAGSVEDGSIEDGSLEPGSIAAISGETDASLEPDELSPVEVEAAISDEGVAAPDVGVGSESSDGVTTMVGGLFDPQPGRATSERQHTNDRYRFISEGSIIVEKLISTNA